MRIAATARRTSARIGTPLTPLLDRKAARDIAVALHIDGLDFDTACWPTPICSVPR
jgi:hypothetical protein